MMAKEIIAKTNDLSIEQWLELRKQGIGGADAAVACGLSKWKSQLELWLEKTNQAKGKPAGEAAYWGHIMEPIIREEFFKRNGLRVKEVPYLFRSKEHPFMQANIDGCVEENDGNISLLEIKTANQYASNDWEDGLPAAYYIQIQHYLEVCGLHKAYIAVLIGGNKYKQMSVERDEETIGNVIKLEEAFWRYVQKRTQPPIDGSDASREILASLYPRSTNTRIMLPPEADPLVSTYLSAKAAEDAAKAQKQLSENSLKDLMKDAECGQTPQGARIYWKSITSVRINGSKLKADLPEIAEKYSTETSSRRFAITAPEAGEKE